MGVDEIILLESIQNDINVILMDIEKLNKRQTFICKYMADFENKMNKLFVNNNSVIDRFIRFQVK